MGFSTNTRRKPSNPLFIAPESHIKSFARIEVAARHTNVRVRVSILGFLMAACLSAQQPSANDLYLSGRKAERAGHMAEAYILYSEAAAMAPNNKMYWLRSQAVSTRAALEAKVMPTPTAPSEASEADENPAPPIPIA